MTAFVSTTLVATTLGVTVRAVTSWCTSGTIAGAKKTPGGRGHWLIPRAFLIAYLPEAKEATERTT